MEYISTPTCCNCRLAEGANPIPQIIWAADMRKRRCRKRISEDTQDHYGRAFWSNLTTPGMSFAAALRGKTEIQQQPQGHQVAVAGPTTMERRVPAALPQHEHQTTGQSFWAINVNILLLDKMLRAVVTVVRKIMTEYNGAVLDEAKIVATTKIA
jgi:hypothetical protein